LGYLIGRYGGRRLLLKCRINERHLVRVEGIFARYGGGVVAAARFFDGLRQLNGLVAGTLEMPWREFLAYNALGATLWVSIWGMGAYFVDRHLEASLRLFHRFEPIVVAFGLLAIALVVVYLFWRPGRASRT
jgi:membrane protein DedA with SNARE-associated domain